MTIIIIGLGPVSFCSPHWIRSLWKLFLFGVSFGFGFANWKYVTLARDLWVMCSSRIGFSSDGDGDVMGCDVCNLESINIKLGQVKAVLCQPLFLSFSSPKLLARPRLLSCFSLFWDKRGNKCSNNIHPLPFPFRPSTKSKFVTKLAPLLPTYILYGFANLIFYFIMKIPRERVKIQQKTLKSSHHRHRIRNQERM